MKKIVYVFTFAIISAVLVCLWCNFASGELENNIVRLHVIANSDSDADQGIKLKVRDAILGFARENGKTPNETQLKSVADKVLIYYNFPYRAKVTYGKNYVNRREYDGFLLPGGIYTAANIELGEAKGKNWWCVLSPPLCFTKSSFDNNEALSKTLDIETADALNGVTIKLRVLEWFAALSQK